MAIASTATFELTRDQLIRRAFQLAGMTEASMSPDSDDIAMAADFLGMELDTLQAEGIVLRTVERATKSLVDGTAEYTLDSDTLDVHVGPDDLLGSHTVTGATGSTYVKAIGRAEYLAISNRTAEGTPTMGYVERGTTSVKIVLWPVPSAAATLTYQRVRMIRDVTSGSVTMDLVKAWMKPVMWAMAHQIILAKAGDLARADYVRNEAERLKAVVRSYDRQRGTAQLAIMPGGY